MSLHKWYLGNLKMPGIKIKTCTVTIFHDGKNYGNFLQAWALQQFLGESNFILNFIPPYVGLKGRRKLPFFWRIIALWRYLFHRKTPFAEIKRLKFSGKYYSRKKIIKSPPDADAFICGSDQMWNYNVNDLSENINDSDDKIYFLDFGPPNIKRVTYAVSMGMKEWSHSFTCKVLPALKKIDAISVREDSAVPFLNSIGLKNIAITCDPTILWTADMYRSNFSQSEKVEYKCSGYIFAYIINKKSLNYMQKFFSGEKIFLYAIHKYKKGDSIAQWLHNIDTSSAIITDSFHGTVFSILFHKSFVSLSSHTGKDERLFSLLRKIGLEYRLLNGSETKEAVEEILHRPIDWEQVDKILEEWRIYSANWLRNALNDN